jgi:hypothetical protein
MTLMELRGKYARLNNEIDDLVAGAEHNPGRMSRLLADLDEVHRQIVSARRRCLPLPTLNDVVELDSRPPLQTAAG